jgi:hypothetical protein
MKRLFCTSCKERERRIKGRLCKECHSAYMRTWRKENPQAPRKRDIRVRIRDLHRTWLRRGKLRKERCWVCCMPAEMHHIKYEPDVANIMWLCRNHHNAWHRVFEVE